MHLRLSLSGIDVSSFALLQSTEISQELSNRLATAKVKFLVQGIGSLYDLAKYDDSTYASLIAGLVTNLAEVIITKQSDGSKVFAGYITRISFDRISRQDIFYEVDATSYGLTLDNTLVNQTFSGSNDRAIIQAVMAGTGITATNANVSLLQSIASYEAKDVSVRQVLDDMCELTGAEWFVDFDRNLKYRTATAVAAPFGFTDQSFAWNIESYSQDMTNPANRVKVVGGLASGGTELTHTANDTASQALYGIQASTVVDRNLRSSSLLQLRANVELARRAYPEQSGTIKHTRDGLSIGEYVQIISPAHGLNGNFAIRKLTMKQIDNAATEYSVEFGAYRPDLSSMLAKLNRESKESTLQPQGIPPENSVTGPMLVDASITGSKIANATITGTQIANATISGANIQSATITGGNIQSGTIVSGNIAASTITGGNIAASTITGGNLASGTITAAQIQNLTITAAQIDNLTINGSKIADNAITNSKVTAGTLTGDRMTNGTITALQIASATITGSNIASATIAGSNIQAGTIAGSNLQTATIAGSNIQAATITGSNIASVTITTGNIADLAITNAKINSLEASKITAGTITASVSMTSPNITSTSGSGTITLNGGVVTSAFGSSLATLGQGFLSIANSSSSTTANLSAGQLNFIASGIGRAVISGGSSPEIYLTNSGGSTVVYLNSSEVNLAVPLKISSNTVINTSGVFTGNGVNCPSYGVAASGFNPNNGTQYFGQTATVVGSFTIGGIPRTNLVFVGGALVGYS